MDISNQQVRDTTRKYFKYLNNAMVLMWRLGFGSWLNQLPQSGGRYMVITHTGRKSGLKHRTPVNYAVVDGEVYCTAGFGSVSDWYRNIVANPGVEIWLPDGWWSGYAEDVTGRPDMLPAMRAVLVASGFAAPLFGVDPAQLTDEALREATRDYRLIHIHRTEARTGPGGPGDLAWVWPLSTLALILLLLFRPCRKS